MGFSSLLGVLELLAAPKLGCRQAQRHPFSWHCQAGVQTYTAGGEVDVIALSIVAGRAFADETHGIHIFSPIAERGGIVQHQHRLFSLGEPLACRGKMSAENLLFPDPLVGEKSIGSLGGAPVLTGQRNTAP